MEDTAMNLANPAQLDIIDGLRRLGISNFVALPQLAVVGDQSSGKSSVLESFSELPFPRDSGLCTRFATQITFRRGSATSTKVSIIPGPDRSPQESNNLRSYVKDGLTALTSNEFLEILQEVCSLMGISSLGQPLETNQSTFSEDLLSIELCGPDKQNLSIIDVPGIFRTPTEGVTTSQDMALVRRIMYRHIKDERTIILAVIPSNTDIATQEILSIAKELDPKGLRTLGVLTKPDLVDKGGEENVISLVEGKRNPLHFGYCIVRNRGQSELSSNTITRRSKEKEFFLVEPWSRLDRDRVGTPALQRRLQELLVSITRREFPKVKAQIVQQLSSCRERLEGLGAERESADQQRQFLLEISHKFQDITSCALDAYYSRHPVFGSIPELRLATLAVERMERYAADIETAGHTIKFRSGANGEMECECEQVLSTPSSNNLEQDSEGSKLNYPELSHLILTGIVASKPSDRDIMKWIEEEYRKARGFGLPSIGPSTFPTIWQEQSKNWEGLTLSFIADIVFSVHDFICRTLAYVCSDENVHANLWSMLQEQLVDSYRIAIDHVKFIIHVERFGTPTTMNRYFSENLQKRKADRLERPLGIHTGSESNLNRDLQIQQLRAMGNSDYVVQDIHDKLEAYYEVARNRFVDIVCMQGIDYYLLTGAPSPLRLFGTAFVSKLSAPQLDLIAGEDVATKKLRESLKNEIDALQKGRDLFKT